MKSLVFAALLPSLAVIAAGSDPDIRQFFPEATDAPTEATILKSLTTATPVGASYVDVARTLMGRKLGHPSWNDPVNANPVRACAWTDHPIDCNFDGWSISYAFDASNTLTEVCVKARKPDAKASCSRA